LNPQVYRQLSAVFSAHGHRPEAEAAATLEDAISCLQQRKWQEAAELSGSVLRFSPDEYPAGYYLYAMAKLHLGNLDAAEESARSARRSDRERRNPRTKYVLGLILAEKTI
jgi:tetratricopeptide (TPR) repeat protein